MKVRAVALLKNMLFAMGLRRAEAVRGTRTTLLRNGGGRWNNEDYHVEKACTDAVSKVEVSKEVSTRANFVEDQVNELTRPDAM